MPASSEAQRRFMGADLARKRAGKKTKTGMSEGDLKDFARSKPHRGSGALTPLGQRTLSGFQKKWGADEGRAKFEKALDDGVLDPDRMLASTKGDDAKNAVKPAAKGELSGAASTKDGDETPRRAASGSFQSRQS